MTAAYFEDHPTDPEKVILRKPSLDQGAGYERGFVDGMQYQMQSSVDKAVNAMSQPTYYIPSKDQRTWVGLTDEEVESYWGWEDFQCGCGKGTLLEMVRDIEAKLKERNT
jgi:hypothetical protein